MIELNPINNEFDDDPRVIDLKEDLVKALLHSDEHFRELVELLPVSLMVHRGGQVIYANPSWLKLVGYDYLEEVIGKSPLTFVHPDFIDTIKEKIRLLTTGTGSTPLIELVFVHKNGELVPVEAQGVAVVYEGVPAVMVVAGDISKRKKTQQELRASEESLENLIEGMPDGILVENSENILFANHALARMLGCDNASEIVGKSPFQFIHPDYHPVIRDRIARIFGKEGFNPLLEYQWIRKDGTPVDVEVSSISIRFEGKSAVMAVVRDISGRKKTQVELEENHLLLQTAQEAGHIGTWIADLSGDGKGETIWSKESYSIFGAKEDEFGGKVENFYSMVYPEDLQRLLQAQRSVLEGTAPFDIEFRIIRSDKEVRWIHSRAGVMRDRKGSSVKLIGTTQDITDRKQTEQALREREQQALLTDKLTTVGTLAAGVAHEINNPLTYVLANLHFLKEQLMDLEKAPHDPGKAERLWDDLWDELNDTIKGAERIRDIVRGLKSFARSNDEEVVETRLDEILDFAMDMIFHEIKHKARVEKQYATGLPKLTANPGKLQQVFVNLLVNAAQAMEASGFERNKITIRTGIEKDGLFVEIGDTGKGIPEDDLRKIFDPFFTTKPVGVGTGLGLSVCDEIIKASGGRIEVKSQVGKGSLFTVHIPLGVQEKAAEAAGLAVVRPVCSKRVLVVDDEPANLEAFCQIFKKGNTVLSALSAKDALGILEREKAGVDVIISDINMPEMDGIEFYRQVGQRFPGLEKKILFVTGGVFAPEVREYLKRIPNRCLEKPLKMGELLSAVAKVTDP